jgi:hypothetical protein
MLFLLIMCLFPAPADPCPGDINERFGGAALMIREASPVPALAKYRDWIAQQKCPLIGMDDGDLIDEIRRARFVWDVWDDLRLAIEYRDSGNMPSCTGVLQSLQRKIGPEAYAVGRMPAMPERAFWKRDAEWQQMPRGEP